MKFKSESLAIKNADILIKAEILRLSKKEDEERRAAEHGCGDTMPDLRGSDEESDNEDYEDGLMTEKNKQAALEVEL